MDPSALDVLPKVVLHDHLDGGVRPATVAELADAAGYGALPVSDPAELRSWFHQAGAGSLEEYLGAFRHTIAVMQTATALERVAYEAVIDLAADGVVYGELRFAPTLHTEEGLDPDDVLEAVTAGLRRGEADTGMVARLICTALRTGTDSEEVARIAVRWRDRGVVAFDLAGPEASYPADDHLVACRVARDAGLGLTIHGGEGDGAHSVWRAWARCGAERIGHGVRIVDETKVVDGAIVELGSLAAAVRDHRLPLEVAVLSNVDTALAADVASHPIGALFDSGFAVTVNTDNRLMSDTSMAREFRELALHHGWGAAEFAEVTETALRAGFGDWPTRRRLLDEVVRPAYAAALTP